jgi:hypothetical protein
MIACTLVMACGHPGSMLAGDAATASDAAPPGDAASDGGLLPGPNEVLIHVRGSITYTVYATGSPNVTATGDMNFLRPAVPNMSVSVVTGPFSTFTKRIDGTEGGDILMFDFGGSPPAPHHPLSITLPPPPSGVNAYVLGARCTTPLGTSSLLIDNDCATAVGPTTIYAAGYDNTGHVADLAVAGVNLMQDSVTLQGTWTAATGSLSVTLHAISPDPGYLSVIQIPLEQNAPLIRFAESFSYGSGHTTDDTVTIHAAPAIGDGFAYGVEWHPTAGGEQVYLVGVSSAPTSMSFDLSTVLPSPSSGDGWVVHCQWYTPETNIDNYVAAVEPPNPTVACGPQGSTGDGEAIQWTGFGSYGGLRHHGFAPLPTIPAVGEVLRTWK